MDSDVELYIHHQGTMVYSPDCKYVGGEIDYIPKADTDKFSFRGIEALAVDYHYNPDCIVVYFKTDGHSFKEGVKVLYNDESIREMINVCLPYRKVELYIEHILDGNVIDNQHMGSNLTPTNVTNETENMGLGDEWGNETSDNGHGEDSESEDSDYNNGSEEEDSDNEDFGSLARNEPVNDFEEDDFDSDDLRSEHSSSEDENMKLGYVGPPIIRNKKRCMRTYNHKHYENKEFKWCSGMRFGSMTDFKLAVRKYGLKERRKVKFTRNEAHRVQVVCEPGCPFYIWASKASKKMGTDTVLVKALLDEHLCTKPYRNKLATVEYLGEVYGDRIRKNPCWKLKDMSDVIRDEFEIEVPKIKLTRIRKYALDGVADKLNEQYARVRDFGHQILLGDNRNTIKIRTTRLQEGDENRFQRLYVCYYALKEGWKKGCRKILGLDGCFLKTVCGGQLLSAVGRDGNNQMFPVAYCVVESENTESWRWFIELLVTDLDLGDGYGFTIISDQQKGLENAVKEYLPHAEHRFCVRHLYSNFRKRFPKQELRDAFWAVSTTTHVAAHTRAMKQLERLSKPAHDYLTKLDPKNWCKAYFQTTSKADNVDNNMCESFNSWIINERYMPILTMMQELHLKMMNRMREMRDEMIRNNYLICPKIKKRLDKAVTWSRAYTAHYDGLGRFAVKQGSKTITVSLLQRSCDCRVWDLTGIPCAHAVACIHDRRERPTDYVDEYFRREKYLMSYSVMLPAMKGEEFWETTSTDLILPPNIPKKLRGRPKRLRRKEEWEGGSGSQSKSKATGKKKTTIAPKPQTPNVQRYMKERKMHCTICRDEGHRRNKCPNRVQEEEPQQSAVGLGNEGTTSGVAD